MTRPRMSDEPGPAVERGDDGVAVVTLDNGKVNALSVALLQRLRTVAEELTADPPGAVVITGGDRIFAAGAQITEFLDDADALPVPGGGPEPADGAGSRLPHHPERRGRHPAGHHRRGRRVRPRRRAASWPWPATSASRRTGPSSVSPRSCSASSRVAAAPSG